jgi:hypothetical protein
MQSTWPNRPASIFVTIRLIVDTRHPNPAILAGLSLFGHTGEKVPPLAWFGKLSLVRRTKHYRPQSRSAAAISCAGAGGCRFHRERRCRADAAAGL